MKFNWLGKSSVMDEGDIDEKFALVIAPAENNDKNQAVLSEVSGLSSLDIKIRHNPDGYFILRKCGDATTLGTAVKQLKNCGIRSFIIDTTKMFDIPSPIKMPIIEFEDDVVRFSKSVGDKTIELSNKSDLFVVKARVTIFKLTEYIRLHGFNVPYIKLPDSIIAYEKLRSFPHKGDHHVSKQETSLLYLDIYDLSQNECVRVIEGNFNATETINKKSFVSPKKDLKKLILTLENIAKNILIDECYTSTSLPYSSGEMETEDEGYMFKRTSKHSTKISNEYKFDQYSKFRFIIEKYFWRING